MCYILYALFCAIFCVFLGRTIADNTTSLIIPDFIETADANEVNSSRVSLNISCETAEVVVDLSFNEPFTGRMFLENDPNTRGCSLFGNGSISYKFRIPLRACGTKREGYEYMNSMIILYSQRQILEMGDQRKVILCQYTVPVAPPFLEMHRSQAGNDEPSNSGTRIGLYPTTTMSKILSWTFLTGLVAAMTGRPRT